MYALSLQSLSDTIDVCLLQENFTNQLYISDFQLEYIYFTHQGAAKFLVKTSFPLPFLLNQTLMKNLLFAFGGRQHLTLNQTSETSAPGWSG